MNIGNPNHPVTQRLATEWHKLCAVLMLEFGVTEIEITSTMLLAFPDDISIVADLRGGKMVLRLVNQDEAAKLVARAGGQAH